MRSKGSITRVAAYILDINLNHKFNITRTVVCCFLVNKFVKKNTQWTLWYAVNTTRQCTCTQPTEIEFVLNWRGIKREKGLSVSVYDTLDNYQYKKMLRLCTFLALALCASAQVNICNFKFKFYSIWCSFLLFIGSATQCHSWRPCSSHHPPPQKRKGITWFFLFLFLKFRLNKSFLWWIKLTGKQHIDFSSLAAEKLIADKKTHVNIKIILIN